ncbi:TolC family protein [Janthinobacterium agaricidamnosum]|uniref:Outer membrane efflux family protein n=1 Tax=Janthinobacterium agaricidamnosum NBRC 102515 = DSM 9628 TaxID=1349767 RepID=W0V777_9BURK|nr:TolC family protein [Janthinobacterium agaricidamnosum]CDG83208.1 outer membrane efflux family protein [Janthinobacterium agaricidamnosum NBRC 102515 = DSM 9628]
MKTTPISRALGALSLAAAVAVSPNTRSAELHAMSLEQAISYAQQHNSDLRVSALGVDSASAAVVAANAPPNPVLSLQTANINPYAGIGAGGLRSKTVDSSVRIDQLFERGGKRAFRVAAAEHLEQASRDDLHDARRQLRLLVSQAYYDVMAGRARLDVARQSAALFDSSLAAAVKRQKAGDLAVADVARVQVDTLRAHNDAAQAESDLYTLRMSLSLLIGQRPAMPLADAGTDWPAAPPPNPAEADSMLARRPDVLAAQSRLDAAIASRKLALASRSADITVGIQAEHYPTSISNTQGSGNSYGVALQIPLMLRYGYQGEIRAAEVAVDVAEENLERARKQARSDVLLGAEQARSAYERARRYDDGLLAAAKKSADAAEFAFQHGALGIMDLLDVRRTWRSTQLEAVAAHADYAKSLAAWTAAISEGKP